MTSFTLLDQDTEKKVALPRNTLKNITIVSNAMLKAGTVNLNRVKDVLPDVRAGKARSASGDYKFLTRFFDQGKLVSPESAQRYTRLMEGLQALCWLVLLSKSAQFGVRSFKYLLLDGTKWEHGDQSIHLLTLCILVGDVAVPIWWEDLQKAGHSSQAERIKMLKSAMERYQLGGMTLLADREYTGIKWFKYLISKGIHFVIRVKEGIYHEAVNAAKADQWIGLKRRAAAQPKGKKVSKRIWLEGMELHYIILKNPRPHAEDELIFMLSNLTSATQAARLYEARWQIEVCFKHLKTNGLNLEEMNVEGKYKRHLMMAMAVLVYCLAIREGLIEEYRKGIRWVLHTASGYYYRAVSVFRKGLSILKRKARNEAQFFKLLSKITQRQFLLIFQNV